MGVDACLARGRYMYLLACSLDWHSNGSTTAGSGRDDCGGTRKISGPWDWLIAHQYVMSTLTVLVPEVNRDPSEATRLNLTWKRGSWRCTDQDSPGRAMCNFPAWFLQKRGSALASALTLSTPPSTSQVPARRYVWPQLSRKVI